MKQMKLNWAVPILLLLISAAPAFAEPEKPETIVDRSKLMFVSEVRPGMKGYGLTVFSGTKIEKFDVEIISVIYNVSPRSNLIMARVSGGPIDKTGVIAGMSGSPIYIDGRMIGALAYSWPFSKEAIAGITPIEEMLEIFNFKKAEEPKTITKSTEPEKQGWASAANYTVALPASISEYAVMKPIMTPMVFSGFPLEVIENFRPQLESYGITPMAGGSFSQQLADIEAPFEEGSAIGVQLVRGDLSASAIGTVTLQQNGKVLAFGHPFMLSGPVSFPMTTAYIHTVLPSLFISTKMSTALKTIGALVQDRSAGIAGIIGGSCDMVPVKLRVGEKGEEPEEYNFEVVKSRQLLPPLIGMALSGSFSRTSSSSGKFAASIHYSIDLDGYPTIKNDDFVSGLSGFPSLASFGLFRDLNMLLNNQFQDLTVKSVSIDVEVGETVETAQITGVRIWKNTVKPGDNIDLKIIMQPYMKKNIEQDFKIQIPENFPEGEAFLQISAASQTATFERMRSPNRFQPTSIEKLIDLVREPYPGNRIDVRLLVSDPGVVINGEEMAALPSSTFSVISQSMGKESIGVTRASVLLEKHLAVDYEVSGFVTVPITIDRKNS
jgi:hypothetical protein